MTTKLKITSTLILLFFFVLSFPSSSLAADDVIGNEVLDTADTTLTRTGDGWDLYT